MSQPVLPIEALYNYHYLSFIYIATGSINQPAVTPLSRWAIVVDLPNPCNAFQTGLGTF
jgi:hypothetical protein